MKTKTKLGISIGVIAVILIVVFGSSQLYKGALFPPISMTKMAEKHFRSDFPNSPWLGGVGYKFRYTGSSQHIIGSIYNRDNRFIKNACRIISGNISNVYCYWSNNESMWANGVNSMDGFYKFKFFEDTTNRPATGDWQANEPTSPQFKFIGESDIFELDVVSLTSI